MSFLDDEILLNQLVEETLEPASGLREMTSYRLIYYGSIQCYQLEAEGRIYTFPSNWGPFAKLKERCGEGVILEEDMEYFNSMFGSLMGSDVKSVFLFMEEELYLVFVPKKMEVDLKDLHTLVYDHSSFKLAA